MLVKKYKKKNQYLEIHTDENSESPREWDNLGLMICSHKEYELGDKQIKTKEELEELTKDAIIKLPLYLYDHSGISMSCKLTYPYDDQWDAGQVGIIMITKEKILKEYECKRISKKLLEKVKEYLVNEVKTYDQYLRGDIYGFNLYKLKKCDMDQDHKIDMDSCWGFYDIKDILNEQGFKEKHEVYSC